MPDLMRLAGVIGFILGLGFSASWPQTVYIPAEVAESTSNGLEMAGHRGLMSVVAEVNAPAPFTTDGCSGGLSAGWGLLSEKMPGFAEDFGAHPPWEGCCVTHDRAYHNAGAARLAIESFAARHQADFALRDCVQADGMARRETIAARYEVSTDLVSAVYGTLADAMYNAVRVGGGPCSGLPWRWGYGFPNCRPKLP